MGNKDSSAAGRRRGRRGKKGNRIDKMLKEQEKANQMEITLMIIGTGDSGKSTLIKQMQIIYKGGFGKREQDDYKKAIRFNLKDHITILLEICTENGYALKPENEVIADEFLTTMRRTDDISEDEKSMMIKLWDDPALKEAYENRFDFQLPDSAAYFLDRIEEICEEDWLPNNSDILNCRISTTGVNEIKFERRDYTWKLVDVGGQRSERRKWVSHFEFVENIIFVSAISEYNQKLFEDQTVNRLDESSETFDRTINSRDFKKKRVILLFNKMDLFKEKIEKFPIGDYFDDYDGDGSAESAREYITEKFLGNLKKKRRDNIAVYYVSATQSGVIEEIFSKIQDDILALQDERE